ncbi:MAG: hypothetical protein WB586_10480 [Chthoniobacterales bacterium]
MTAIVHRKPACLPNSLARVYTGFETAEVRSDAATHDAPAASRQLRYARCRQHQWFYSDARKRVLTGLGHLLSDKMVPLPQDQSGPEPDWLFTSACWEPGFPKTRIVHLPMGRATSRSWPTSKPQTNPYCFLSAAMPALMIAWLIA